MIGEAIQTVESKWGQSIERMFDTPESQKFVPDPHIWPAYLNAAAATVGHFRPPAGKTEMTALLVRVNHGVWQTVCPFCPSAQHGSSSDRWFFCARCHNETVGLCSIPVIWPDEAEVLAEFLLEVDHIAMRNWEPGETASDIEQQLRLYQARMQG